MEDMVSTLRWDLLWQAITRRVYKEIVHPHILLHGNIDEWIGRVAALFAMGLAFRLVKSFQTAITLGTASGAAASLLVYLRRRWKRSAQLQLTAQAAETNNVQQHQASTPSRG
ncbi:Aste57867_3168 [Aphanomyces stellatus]|uniref:Aste57867_3168 protein n=1 Tax=Aphanomyces stellatus TaxID=120398 RepID=A0A485KBK6_9STRA|nr:hypothetical protein As57867_003159 [Aphanomyces stellatus]VFT80342.1 Aste57867_3168 [Aphanomyces stellatus]